MTAIPVNIGLKDISVASNIDACMKALNEKVYENTLEALCIENNGLQVKLERFSRYLSCAYTHPHTLLKTFVCNKCGWTEAEFRE